MIHISLDKQETEFVDLKLQPIALDSREPSLDIKFQVCSRAGVCTIYNVHVCMNY